MMEVSHGRRERSYYEEEDEAASKPCEPAARPVEREHMFDKVVTPSDVGKLNRLVIPKQYAEKYFPLDPTNGDKGLLLCFEEGVTGKPWRFRYSYWNSSQSYVMTKGWSRFVKEKRLDPGDTVSFGRGLGDSGRGRLFIDWRSRPPDPLPMIPLRSVPVPWGPSPSNMYGGGSSSSGGGGLQYLYFRSTGATLVPQVQFGVRPTVLESVPVIHRRKAEPKRVRLFGVNLECSEPDDDSQPKPPLSPLQWRVMPPRSEPKSLMQFKGKGEE